MIPPTVVCSIDKRHSYETALAYQEAGALLRFVTGFYLSTDSVRRLPAFAARLSKRADPRLESNHVVSMPFVELLGAVAARILGLNLGFGALLRRAVLFDRRCTGWLEGAGSVHCFEWTARKTFEVARTRGLRTVFDAPTVHHATWRRILEEDVLPIAPDEGRRLLARIDRTSRRKDEELALADRILVPSEWCAASFRASLPNPDRIVLVPYGTSVREGEPRRPEGKVRFLCLSSGLGVLKGTHQVLAAFASLRQEAELWLAGPVLPDLVPHLAAHADSVRLFGSVGPAQIQQLFDQCHAFLSPSLCEGSSLAVLEAMGQGLPVVITERCGAPVKDGVEGIVVPANQSAPLLEAMTRLRDPDLRLAMGAHAKDRARTRTWASYRQAVRKSADLVTVPEPLLRGRKAS